MLLVEELILDKAQNTTGVDPGGPEGTGTSGLVFRRSSVPAILSLHTPPFYPAVLVLVPRAYRLMLVCDEGCNPFYCSVDAATFLRNLRLRLALHRHSQDHHLRRSFAACLLRECGDLGLFAPESDVHVVPDQDPPYLDAPKLPLIPTQTEDFLTTHTDRLWIPVSPPSPPASPLSSSSTDARQKLPGDWSDLRGASLWAKSSDDVNCGSFELSGKAEKIKFSVPSLVYSPVDPLLDRYHPQETGVDNLVARIQELEGLCSDWLRFSA